MRIGKLEIKNFKAVKDIILETDKYINVIVGPNAVGKTTILEAIRLAKGLLSPRYLAESQQVLTSLGALSPHFQFLGVQGFDFSAIANDDTKDLEINIDFSLSPEEIQTLNQQTETLAVSILQSRMARSEDGSTFQLTQFLSSPEGQEALTNAKKDVTQAIAGYDPSRPISIRMKVLAGTNTFQGNDIYGQLAIATLERALPPQHTKFSYFPADRAFPQGEVAIQLGSADAQNQVQAHMGTPGAKYGRLKISLAQGFLLGDVGQAEIDKRFSEIFQALLPGKKFSGVMMNEIGIMKVMVEDLNTSKKFDIDNLSSGEKGIVSTFLLAGMAMAKGGILMLDEPELHLNPAVTRNLLPYIINYCQKNDVQVFICTHSPEVLSEAYESDECKLFHLRSGTDLSPVYRQDEAEVLEILDRLGASTADVLFSKGNIFVEGDHDEEILNEGFGHIVGGYKITQLGGRGSVEKAIRDLEENPGSLGKVRLFLFDLDRKPSGIVGKGNVVVRQWGRYCLENYLLDDKPLYDAVVEYAKHRPASRGEFVQHLRADALSQIDGVALREVYEEMEPSNGGLRAAEIKNKSIEESSKILSSRLSEIKSQLDGFDRHSWESELKSRFESKKSEMMSEWENDWKQLASGKLLIDALYERYTIRLDKLSFKKKVARLMKIEQTESWLAASAILADAIKSN